MTSFRRAAAFLLAGWPAAALAAVQIDHEGAACLVAGKHPRLEARLVPPEQVARARLLFRADEAVSWHYVDMVRTEAAFSATLPRPLKTTASVRYYVEVIDHALAAFRTAEYEAQVVDGPAACRKDLEVAVSVDTAGVSVGSLTPGDPVVPPGFSSVGIVGQAVAGAAGAAGTAASGGAAAGAAASAGLSATTVAIGIAAAGAAAAGIAVIAGGDDCTSGGAAEFSVATPLQGALSCADYPRGDETFTIRNPSCAELRLLGVSGRVVMRCATGTSDTAITGSPFASGATVGAGGTLTFTAAVPPPPCRGPGPPPPPNPCTFEILRTIQTSAGPVSTTSSFTLDFSTCPPCG